MNIAVLLTCHNRRNKTITCLNSLFNAELPKEYSLEVFLVDDGSTDGTGEAVKKHFPEINVIQGTGNLFWNKGMHLAWQSAVETKDFDYYLWLNDDTIPFRDSFKTVLSNAQEKENKAIICGTTLSSNLEKFTYGGKTAKNGLIQPQKPIQECETINGNFVLIPKFVYKNVGLNDSIFPHALGDYDYSLRAISKGIKSYVASKPVATCDLNESLPIWCLPKKNILKRMKNLYSPLGNSHPYYYFIYENRHFGIITSIKHFITIHLRLLFPKLWLK